jgi:hypothetical protein
MATHNLVSTSTWLVDKPGQVTWHMDVHGAWSSIKGIPKMGDLKPAGKYELLIIPIVPIFCKPPVRSQILMVKYGQIPFFSHFNQ